MPVGIVLGVNAGLLLPSGFGVERLLSLSASGPG
jgi:hypothetical protein